MSSISNFIIGKTRSKRIAKCFDCKDSIELSEIINFEVIDYTQYDFFDVYCMFEHLIQREIKKHSLDSDRMFLYEKHRKFISNRMNSQFFEEEKQRLHIVTSIDLCKFGSNLVEIEFRDF